MAGYLHWTIVTLTSELAASCSFGGSRSQAPYDDVVDFVLCQLNRTPWPLRLGIKTFTAAFAARLLIADFWPCIVRKQSSGVLRQIEAWRSSKLGACRNLMRFYTSLVVLSLYSRADADRSPDAA
jgi:hypothetical protein